MADLGLDLARGPKVKDFWETKKKIKRDNPGDFDEFGKLMGKGLVCPGCFRLGGVQRVTNFWKHKGGGGTSGPTSSID